MTGKEGKFSATTRISRMATLYLGDRNFPSTPTPSRARETNIPIVAFIREKDFKRSISIAFNPSYRAADTPGITILVSPDFDEESANVCCLSSIVSAAFLLCDFSLNLFDLSSVFFLSSTSRIKSLRSLFSSLPSSSLKLCRAISRWFIPCTPAFAMIKFEKLTGSTTVLGFELSKLRSVSKLFHTGGGRNNRDRILLIQMKNTRRNLPIKQSQKSNTFTV